MAIIIVKESSRRSSELGESPSRERIYTLWGSGDPDEIESALIDGTDAWKDGAATVSFPGVPTTNSGLILKSTSIESNEADEGVWEASVIWGEWKLPTPQTQGEVRTYSRAGIRQVKVKTSRQTVQSVAVSDFNGGTPVDFSGLVNVQEDGSVEGVDIPEPHVVFGVKKIVATSTVSDNSALLAQSIVGKLNDTDYRGRPTGTLRCESVSFNYVNENDTEIAAEFAYAPHLTGLVVGGISGISKNAWDYLWPYKIKRKGSNGMQSKTVQVNVERVHETANFATALGF